MKLSIASTTILAVTLSLSPMKGSHAFQAAHSALARRTSNHATTLFSSPSADDVRRIMEEESTNPATLADSAAAMKNMTPEDMEKLISEMDNMPEAQKAQLKDMGMDPDTMMVSMRMMKENPQMMATAQKLMSNMTPEQMLEQSKAAQAKMSSMSKEELEKAAEMAKDQMENLSPDMIDEAVKAMKDSSTDSATPVPEGIVAGSSSDPNVMDALFKVGEIMSRPPTGKVTFQAFSTLPPITLLSGDREQDLSRQELAECWSDGSLGSTRVDRAGFERVWKEVQEYFEDDVMEEARVTSHPKVKKTRGSAEVVESASPQVGGSMTEDQMKQVNEQVKTMTDDDMQQMLEGMADIGPEEEARMRAMGADPAMMRKAADMMKSNPMMRKAAQMMMKNMSPDQMLQASQQAQTQMSNMSEADLQKAMEQMKEEGK
mmetsp:Transcript_14109/g.30665  ORF Transcript_14109/g.30665 Transcript_14109/m.30665 type:complete len:431 (-) Transcript_14109:92-1384(-)|eukprot:CAMPEP_0172298108 /NCGR_PEP_ID=MMETSP1058-20130122/899_1 /TAXON_ID=83371 /ORGANISM="Detonula confervacea, Strain CCMP 353" /LENGTH=430 /DNA_ID=CAMNT_0013007347 /DNA_START=95 /DNA_END=1387 /DNA_ORIENTATION=+